MAYEDCTWASRAWPSFRPIPQHKALPNAFCFLLLAASRRSLILMPSSFIQYQFVLLAPSSIDQFPSGHLCILAGLQVYFVCFARRVSKCYAIVALVSELLGDTPHGPASQPSKDENFLTLKASRWVNAPCSGGTGRLSCHF